MATTKRAKPRMRVELHTPKGNVHAADRSLSDSLTELMTRSEKTKDKHDILRVVEGVAELGARMVTQVAAALVRSLRGSKG